MGMTTSRASDSDDIRFLLAVQTALMIHAFDVDLEDKRLEDIFREYDLLAADEEDSEKAS